MVWKITRRIIESLTNLGNLEKKVGSILKELVTVKSGLVILKNEFKNYFKVELKTESPNKPLIEPTETRLEPQTEPPVATEIREKEYISNQEGYKINYEKINELYTDPDQRMRVLVEEKEKIGNFEPGSPEQEEWYIYFLETYLKSKAHAECEKYVEKKYIRRYLNEEARKKMKADPRFNVVKVTRSAYEKAKYASRRVTEILEDKVEIRFASFAGKNSDVINDFFISAQTVSGGECMTISMAEDIRLNKNRVGAAHSHHDMTNVHHSTWDKGCLEDWCRGIISGGIDDYYYKPKVIDFHNGDEEKNKRFNFKVRYFSSIILYFKKEPEVYIGALLDKLDEEGGKRRRNEYFCNTNVKLEIIEDGKDFDRKLVDKEIRERVFINRDIRDIDNDGKVKVSLDAVTPATYIPYFIPVLSTS